jgi:hypothetical protein
LSEVELFDRVAMSALCYPYGQGITCVCDEGGRIYKCFPEIKSDSGAGGRAVAQAQGVQGGRGQLGEEHDTMDRR